MEFGKIKKDSGRIMLEEWKEIINSTDSLKQVPDRKGVNPFSNEDVIFSGEGKACYLENNEEVGNISLEEGELLTTGIPISICNEIAEKLGAVFVEDDRS